MNQQLEHYKKILASFPFLTITRNGDQEYVGIIQNQDVAVSSMYSYNLIRTAGEKNQFLNLGHEWWWETNRKIPINIVLGKRFELFRYALISFSNRDFEILMGPTLSLHNLSEKRVKRKSVQLIRKVT